MDLSNQLFSTFRVNQQPDPLSKFLQEYLPPSQNYLTPKGKEKPIIQRINNQEQKRQSSIETSKSTYKKDQSYLSNSSSYISAMKALQDKIKQLECELKEKNRNQSEQCNKLSLELVEAQRNIKDLKAQEISLNDRIIKLKQENDFLHSKKFDIQRSTSKSEDIVSDLRNQVDILQNDRVIQLKDYQEKCDKFIKRIEEITKEKEDQGEVNKSLQKQVDMLRQNEKFFQTRLDATRNEEATKYIDQINILQSRIQQLEQSVKKTEVVFDNLFMKRNNIKNNQMKEKSQKLNSMNIKKWSLVINFMVKYKIDFIFKEQERQLNHFKQQLEEKEKYFQERLKEQIDLGQYREEQLNRKLQDYMDRHNENQTIIHQQSLEYKDIQNKYNCLLTRMENIDNQDQMYLKDERNLINKSKLNSLNQSLDEQKSQQTTQNNFFSRNGSNKQLKFVSKLNLESVMPLQNLKESGRQKEQQSNVSERINSQLKVNNVESKQALIDCLDELNKPSEVKQVKYRNSRNISFNPQIYSTEDDNKEEQIKNKMKSLTIHSSQDIRYGEIDKSLKQLNEKYEALIRQAQLETDFKKKAEIRHELLDLTDQIKQLNNQLYQLSSQRG